ncbi:helix-turn-helix domain-containing protein [Cohnella sp. 56]|uniref:helix-turn-helix domain-containing protein n=1 Tax=Cohnella sp. 56 TaxID=3113722 RepID=UPI0040400586
MLSVGRELGASARKRTGLPRGNDHNVAWIASECGFGSMPHFHRLFKRIVGRTLSFYRRESD